MSFVALGTAIAGVAGASATTAAAVGAGAGLLSKGYAGYKAQQVDTSGMAEAATQLSMAERKQLQQTNDLSLKKINMNLENQIDTLASKGNQSMFKIFEMGESLGNQDFASSEQAQGKIDMAKANIHSEYGTNVDKIMADADLSKQSISLGSQKSKADIEQRFQANITQASSVADTFWEGFTGQSDYQINSKSKFG